MKSSAEGIAAGVDRSLAHHGASTLQAGQNHCADCGRTPLVGEDVYLYASSPGIVCELCSDLRREPVLASRPVRDAERGDSVLLRVRRARHRGVGEIGSPLAEDIRCGRESGG